MISTKLTGGLPGVIKNFETSTKAELKEVMRLSAKKFVRAASAQIPKRSNMARSSLSPLADAVGTQLKRGPAPRSTGRIPKGQTPARGRALSDFTVTHNKFMWSTEVPYFGRHERAEWNSVIMGLQAFLEEFEIQIVKANLPAHISSEFEVF